MITNYEVLQVLRYNERYRCGQDAADMSSNEVIQLENEVKGYLESTPVSGFTRDTIQSLVESLKPFGLAKQELNQILNVLPRYLVELYLIVPLIGENFSEEQISQLMEIILKAREQLIGKD